MVHGTFPAMVRGGLANAPFVCNSPMARKVTLWGAVCVVAILGEISIGLRDRSRDITVC